MNQLQQKKESVLKCLMYVVLIIKFLVTNQKHVQANMEKNMFTFTSALSIEFQKEGKI